MKESRRHFIVKHNIEAFEALPNFIWNSGYPKSKMPHGYRKVRKGDRWIGFGYTATTAETTREERLSLVTGLYECVRTARFHRLPPKAREEAGHKGGGWFIEGRQLLPRMEHPLAVPSINTMLGRKAFGRTTLVPIGGDEFDRIRDYVRKHKFDPTGIPLFGREPHCEQEVLAMVALIHKSLGIEKILRARTRFPDMLVKLKGKRYPVHLELELNASSFMNHDHHSRLARDGTYFDKADKKLGRLPVGVLCWIDDDKHAKKGTKKTRVRDYVKRVFELQSLVRENARIFW